MNEEKPYPQVYEEFWKDIVETNGVLDKDKVMRELADYYQVMENAGKVYCHITDGRISKLLTYPSVVISVAQDIQNELTNECIDEAIDEIIEMIKESREIEKQNMEEIEDKNCVGFGMAMGAYDELGYLFNQIKERWKGE